MRHPLARHALPLAAAHALGEGAHPLDHRLHVGIHILPVDDQCGGRARGSPQRGVEDGAVLGRVDVLAGEHRGVTLGDAGLLGQAHERGHDLVRHEILRQVDVQVGQPVGQAPDPPGILCEPAPQVGGEGCAMRFELRPGGGGCGIDRSAHGPTLSSADGSLTASDQKRSGDGVPCP